MIKWVLVEAQLSDQIVSLWHNITNVANNMKHIDTTQAIY